MWREWLKRRWKTISLVVLAFALYGIAKLNPELQLEQKLLETLQRIVEQATE